MTHLFKTFQWYYPVLLVSFAFLSQSQKIPLFPYGQVAGIYKVKVSSILP
jgi:hypothetical protein